MRLKFERIIEAVWLSKADFKIPDYIDSFGADVLKECHDILEIGCVVTTGEIVISRPGGIFIFGHSNSQDGGCDVRQPKRGCRLLILYRPTNTGSA